MPKCTVPVFPAFPPERRKFSKAAQKQMAAARPQERENFGWPTVEGHMARLAVLAFCPKSAACRRMNFSNQPRDIKQFRVFTHQSGVNDYEEAAARILSDRRPVWADQWLECQIADGEPHTLSPEIIRRLIHQGVCRKPDTLGYARVVASIPPPTHLGQDPELLEDAWRLFQMPTGAFGYLTHIKPKDVEDWKEITSIGGWPRAIYCLAHQGVTERGRLFDELVGALWRDPKHLRRLKHCGHCLLSSNSRRSHNQRRLSRW